MKSRVDLLYHFRGPPSLKLWRTGALLIAGQRPAEALFGGWSGCWELNPVYPDTRTLRVQYGACLLSSLKLFGRGAGNRTRSICSQSRRTTGILLPVKVSG